MKYRYLWRAANIGEDDRDARHGCWNIIETNKRNEIIVAALLKLRKGYDVEVRRIEDES